MEKDAKIYIAGHRGLVGSALLRKLEREGYSNIIYRSSAELDLRRQERVESFLKLARPEYVVLAAAKVGGIEANQRYSADFLYDNLMIQTNVIDSAYRNGVKKLLFMGSSCIYPKYARQPIKEEYLLSGKLESTNEAYAIAKIAGLKMCQHYNQQYGTCFIAVMPSNLYGPGDNFDPDRSHVLPALLRKIHQAKVENQKEVVVWGSGTPRREFLHVDDLAEALLFLIKIGHSPQLVNIGVGKDITIRELAMMLKEIVGFKGGIVYDRTKPDGTPRKLLDISRVKHLGWQAKISLEQGIKQTYQSYLASSRVFK
ncbi:MAG: GDP-L-fucose synthase [Halanaerobiales bacterium]|nr:GDP-L-fucose synthase [Halanaerobiales bacterium]